MCGHRSVTPTWDRDLALTLVYHTSGGTEVGPSGIPWACTCHVHNHDCWWVGSHIRCWGCCRKKGVADCGWQASHMAKPHGFTGSWHKWHKQHRCHISHIFFWHWLVIWSIAIVVWTCCFILKSWFGHLVKPFLEFDAPKKPLCKEYFLYIGYRVRVKWPFFR